MMMPKQGEEDWSRVPRCVKQALKLLYDQIQNGEATASRRFESIEHRIEIVEKRSLENVHDVSELRSRLLAIGDPAQLVTKANLTEARLESRTKTAELIATALRSSSVDTNLSQLRVDLNTLSELTKNVVATFQDKFPCLENRLDIDTHSLNTLHDQTANLLQTTSDCTAKLSKLSADLAAVKTNLDLTNTLLTSLLAIKPPQPCKTPKTPVPPPTVSAAASTTTTNLSPLSEDDDQPEFFQENNDDSSLRSNKAELERERLLNSALRARVRDSKLLAHVTATLQAIAAS